MADLACEPVELEVCKTADEDQVFEFIWTMQFSKRWEPMSEQVAGDSVRPSILKRWWGFDYVVQADGVTNGVKEPNWARVLGEITEDGSLAYAAALPTYDGLAERILTVEWTVPAGMDWPTQQDIDMPASQRTRILTKGGTQGQRYEGSVLVTTTLGQKYQGILGITII